MNPLTQIKNTQKATQREIAAGFSDSASWHYKYRHSAYIFAGGLPFELTEGDLLAVFAQYGEIVDVNLVRCGSAAAAGRCTPVRDARPAFPSSCAASVFMNDHQGCCHSAGWAAMQGQGHWQATRLCLPCL